MTAWTGGDASDIETMLERWRRSGTPHLPCPPGTSPRMHAAAHGLLAALLRRGVRHARLRIRPGDAALTLGEQRRVPLDESVAVTCLASLREAASLPAASTHAAGSFSVAGESACIETYRCHEGDRAFIHLDGGEPAPLRSALAELPRLSAEALDALHGHGLAPEDLIAARRVSSRADEAGVLARHADFTLLVEDRGLSCAEVMRDGLQRALCDVVSRGDWRTAWDPAVECSAWLRRHAAHPLAEVLSACRQAATPDARSVLGHVLPH